MTEIGAETPLGLVVPAPGSMLVDVASVADARTIELLERRRRTARPRRRGWLIRRMLLLADVVGLSLAFAVMEVILGAGGVSGHGPEPKEIPLLLATLPGWIVIAKLYRLYDHDEERTHHGATDDFAGIFHLVTVGVWLFYAVASLTGIAHPELAKMVAFWAFAIAAVTLARIGARTACRRSITYLQNTIVVGAGEVGQQVARKLLRHPEYGLNLVGFVDSQPLPLGDGLDHVRVLGPPDDLERLVRLLDVERLVIAFSGDSPEETLELIRSVNDEEVQIDVVPRLFELVSPGVQVDTLEGLPLVELPPRRISRSSAAIKRALDVLVSSFLLLLTSPLFAYAAYRVKRDSPGPVFFRQTRLGLNQREFTALKFRTMRTDVDQAAHRNYMRRSMDPRVAQATNGLYKPGSDAVTPVGRWLRKTSLDELPQLINVLRGEMSLVGPRPCLPYETEHFLPHHFDRFLVPAGITGLWQVTARARATFREALDMDVAYAHGWSLGLDLQLLMKTPFEAFGRRATT
jgi:exopolysaccharide biosynthesis polyprenyl glycosylphosphotransferase